MRSQAVCSQDLGDEAQGLIRSCLAAVLGGLPGAKPERTDDPPTCVVDADAGPKSIRLVVARADLPTGPDTLADGSIKARLCSQVSVALATWAPTNIKVEIIE